MIASLERVADAVARWSNDAPRPLILGICGSQGSGKSTLASALISRMARQGMRGATLSLDDLYLGRAERANLATSVHPLLATRGVPMTHDVSRGCAILDAARAGQTIELPRFDKASDEPAMQSERIEGPLDLLIFEGWCVGAVAEPPEALAAPVNDLERDEDPDGRWRGAVNAELAGTYRDLFARLDRLVLLAAPGFEVVQAWRTQQEQSLRAKLVRDGRNPDLAMDDAQIARFIQLYERITLAILREMPARADLTLRLDAQRGLNPDL